MVSSACNQPQFYFNGKMPVEKVRTGDVSIDALRDTDCGVIVVKKLL